MKYNAHIYLHRLSLGSLQVVKLLFPFCANAKLKDIAGIVNHHYPFSRCLGSFIL